MSGNMPLLQADGSVSVAATIHPMPGGFSDEARGAFLAYFQQGGDPAFSGDVANIRRIYDEEWAGPLLRRWAASFPVRMARTAIAGVPVDEVEPPNGVADDRSDKVLISLHGGAFVIGGGGIGGRIEAIPMAAIGGYRVVAVDYRQAPEAAYPAATDDVERVYGELLKTYSPEKIGIYGSSAGGMLAAQITARLHATGRPRPGAIAILAAGATKSGPADSLHWAMGLTGARVTPPATTPALPSYYAAADMADPMAWPAESPTLLAAFPPTLILSSSRDTLLGYALDTHTRLREARVDSRLYVRHGFGHGYFTQAPDLPEAIAAWREVIAFFEEHLAPTAQAA